jgi:phosphomannomutase
VSERLRFGTAGLRAALGDGPNRMNNEIVSLTARAIAEWLPANSIVAIGRDARYGSEDFAAVTAQILAEAGHTPQLFDRPVPTPVVAWAVRHSDAAAGVMVTASHNPATDNGYKVYAADGGQILPDAAEVIEQHMDAYDWPDKLTAPTAAELTDGGIGELGQSVIDAYLESIARPRAVMPLTIVYTAMHGVGAELATLVLTGAGHEVHSVPEQNDPDPDFPTADFPNPEEPGTLDLAMALADDVDASLILANDPDADRLAVAIHRGGPWKRFTGDEVGAILGTYLLENSSGPRAVSTTIVSSSLLEKIAASHGVPTYTVLTGFKWLAKAADDHPETPMLFGYEEALGYGVNFAVRDKDGVAAALVFAECASVLASQGKTLDDELDRIYEQFGVHVSGQVSKRFDGDNAMEQMTAFMGQLRMDTPTTVGSAAVTSVNDLIGGGDLPPSDVLIYQLEGGRLIIRPSGTEPKVKAYLEAVADDREAAQARLEEFIAAAGGLLGL